MHDRLKEKGYTQINTLIPEEDRKRFAAWCMQRNTKMSVKIREFIYECLESD